MYAQVEKSKENKSRAVVNAIGQKKSKIKQSFGFVDNRPEAATQRKLQDMIGGRRQPQLQNKTDPTQRYIRVDGMSDGERFEDLSDFVPVNYRFNTDAKALFLAWIRDGEDHHFATKAEMQVNVMEKSEGAHSIERHGPAVSNAALEKRLFTGIAPDNVLSPAPGASSRFLSYEELLETRQTAAYNLQVAIAAAQAKVLEWKRDVLTPGVLNATVIAKTKAHDKAVADAKQTQTDLDQYGKKHDTQIDALKLEVADIDKKIQEKEEEIIGIDLELQGGTGMFGEVTLPAEGDEKIQLQKDSLKVGGEKKLLEQNFSLKQAEYDVLNDTKGALRDANLAAQALILDAQAEKFTADDELNNPGKNLTKYLKNQHAMALDVSDKAGLDSFDNTVKLENQYSIVVDHGKDIGTGKAGEAGNDVSLTDVFNQVAADVDAPTPKPRADVKLALQHLGLVNELDALVDFIIEDAGGGIYSNLARLKSKGERGGKIFKIAIAAGNLQKSFTMFSPATRNLFDNRDAPIQVITSGWKSIQHFPAKNDADVGVQKKV